MKVEVITRKIQTEIVEVDFPYFFKEEISYDDGRKGFESGRIDESGVLMFRYSKSNPCDFPSESVEIIRRQEVDSFLFDPENKSTEEEFEAIKKKVLDFTESIEKPKIKDVLPMPIKFDDRAPEDVYWVEIVKRDCQIQSGVLFESEPYEYEEQDLSKWELV